MSNAVEYSIPLTTSSKGDLFESNVKLSCYPKEFIFAEKLETIIYRGSFNSRMKDFHDLYSMISSSQLPSFIISKELSAWYLSIEKPILLCRLPYEEDEMNRMQNFWNEYLKNLRAENLALIPENIADVIAKINNWLRLNTGIISS